MCNDDERFDDDYRRTVGYEQLCDIALSTASIARHLTGETPRVAMLSFASKSASNHPSLIKVRQATELARAKAREVMHGSRTLDAFSKFEILERRADFAEGRADALGLTGPKSLEEELAELKAAEKVDAELEAMKTAIAARNQ